MEANKRSFRVPCGIDYECIPQEGSSTECGDCGQPIGEDYRGRRGTARIRCGTKKVKGRKRRLLVDTEGLILEAKVHSAKVVGQEGI
jgi:hypothetical protein